MGRENREKDCLIRRAMSGPPQWLVVGTYGEHLPHVKGKAKGVYSIPLKKNGTKTQPPKHQLTHLKNPTWIQTYRDHSTKRLLLYVVDERYDPQGGTVTAAALDEETGDITQLGPSVLAGGKGTCHLCVSPGGKHVLVANYAGGSVCAIERYGDGSLGKLAATMQLPPAFGGEAISFPRTNLSRQDAGHAHMVKFVSPNRVLVPDLGCDIVWVINYDADAETPLSSPVASAKVPKLNGAGPRHVALHPRFPAVCVAYVAYELMSLVAAFDVNKDGELVGEPLYPGALCSFDMHMDTHSDDGLAPPFVEGRKKYGMHICEHNHTRGGVACSDMTTSIAAIRISPDGCWLVVSNRIVGSDGALSVVKLNKDGSFDGSVRGMASSNGLVPRDFIIVREESGNDVVLAANQESDTIYSIPLTGPKGNIELLSETPTPVCLAVAPEMDSEKINVKDI